MARFAHVEVRSLAIPEGWPEVAEGPFDLVVLSEVAYYLTADGLRDVLQRLDATLAPSANVIAVHWLGETNYPLRGHAVHAALERAPRRSASAWRLSRARLRPRRLRAERGVSARDRPIDALGVVIPVHDEAERLPACLAALDRRRRASAPRPVRAAVALVLDACTDASDADRRRLEPRAPTTDRVLSSIAPSATSGARAPPAWTGCSPSSPITAQSACGSPPPTPTRRSRPPGSPINSGSRRSGAEAVAGSIDVRDWSDHPPGWAERFRELYEPAGSSDSHDHVHGANLGVRADAYLAAGGFEPLSTGEDHALWNALRRARRRQVSSRRLSVVTSARRIARAPLGFSAFLAAMATPFSAAS